jgi:hypothetical protein
MLEECFETGQGRRCGAVRSVTTNVYSISVTCIHIWISTGTTNGFQKYKKKIKTPQRVIIYLYLLLYCFGKQFCLYVILFKLGRISKQIWSRDIGCVKYISEWYFVLRTSQNYMLFYSRGVQISEVTATKFCKVSPNICLWSMGNSSKSSFWHLEIWGVF